MKRSILATLSATLLLSSVAPGQTTETKDTLGWKVSSWTIGHGESAFSKGISASIDIEHANGITVSGTAGEDQAYVILSRTLPGTQVNLAATAGVLQNTPWGGPRLILSTPEIEVAGTTVQASTLHWPGWSLGVPGDIDVGNSQMMVYFGAASLQVGDLRTTMAWMKFLDGPWNALPGVSYELPITASGDSYGVTISVDRNVNAHRTMIWVGLTRKY